MFCLEMVAPFTGGSISFTASEDTLTSSGAIHMKTVNTGTARTSGSISFCTGTTSSGSSVSLFTGLSTGVAGGDFNVAVGSGTVGVGRLVHITPGESAIVTGEAVSLTADVSGAVVQIVTKWLTRPTREGWVLSTLPASYFFK